MAPPPNRLRSGLGRALAGVATLWLALWSAEAAACTISCQGSPPQCSCSGTGLCEITTGQTVSAGATIDCSGRDVEVEGGAGSIEVSDGFLTLLADDLTVNAQRAIRATRSGSAPFGVIVRLTGAADIAGEITARSGTGGGAIDLEAQGAVAISAGSQGGNGLDASGTSQDAGGGSIQITSGDDVTIEDPLTAKAADAGTADGGDIGIEAQGDITVDAPIDVLGRKSAAGDVQLRTPGAITVSAAIRAEGHGVDGDGGAIELDGGTVTADALVTAQGGVGATGGLSQGGSVTLRAGTGGVAIDDDVNVTGGASGAGLDGGALVVESRGPVAIASGVSILSRSENGGGDGGNVIIEADGALSVGAATIDARGHSSGSNHGRGAAIKLAGCALGVASGAILDVRGYDGGSIHLIGRETLTVHSQSSLEAVALGQNGADGEIALEYRADGVCSSVSGRGCYLAQCSSGLCSNYPDRSCSSHNDCTGCPTGACAGSNPDTGGVTTQFDPAPRLIEDRDLPGCG